MILYDIPCKKQTIQRGGAFQIIAWRAGTWLRPYENRCVTLCRYFLTNPTACDTGPVPTKNSRDREDNAGVVFACVLRRLEPFDAERLNHHARLTHRIEQAKARNR